MRVAITADFHLTTEDQHPERYQALRSVLAGCRRLGVDRLIIAGDLFDRTQHNFADFEAALREVKPEELPVIILPGNHDPDLQAATFTSSELSVVRQPQLLQVADDFELLLIPYQAGSTMGQQIAAFHQRLTAGRWALVGHGDWMGGARSASADEPGVYMPLTRKDLKLFQPAFCLLGHIHAPVSEPPIYYAGSPCPLDVTETGPRRLLLFDCEERSVHSEPLESERVYFDEKVVMLPVEDEAAYLESKLKALMSEWQLEPSQKDKVLVRLKLSGYVADRSALVDVCEQVMADYAFYPGSPDLSDLNLAVDPDRNEIARRVEALLREMAFKGGTGDPNQSDMLEAALAVIYGS